MTATPESFVDALNAAFGKQTTQRSAHAKGVVLLGEFVPSAEAASVSKALHFERGGAGTLAPAVQDFWPDCPYMYKPRAN